MSQERSQSPITASSPSGTLKMKSELSRGHGGMSLPPTSGLPSVGLSSQAVGSKFFNKGPIKPTTSLNLPAQMLPTEQMFKQQHHTNQHMGMGRQPFGVSPKDFEEYYNEEYDPENEDSQYGDEAPQRAGGRILSPEQERQILNDLLRAAQTNKEFFKVLNILQNDPELRPLIFEHEALLRALKDMKELKAEQMLSILTAAETEMYESSKKHEETQQMNKSGQSFKPPSRDASVDVQLINTDEIRSLESTIKELQIQSSDYQNKFKDENGEKKKFDSEIKAMKQQVKTLQESSKQEVEQLTRQLNMMAEQLNQAKTENEQLQKIKPLLDASQIQSDKSRQEVAKLKQQLLTFEQKSKENTQTQDQLKAETVELKGQLFQAQQDKLNLTEENASLQAQLSQMKLTVKAEKSKFERLQQEINKQRPSRDESPRKTDENTEMLDVARRQIAQHLDEISQLKTMLSQQNLKEGNMATFSPKKSTQQDPILAEVLDQIGERLFTLNKKVLSECGVTSRSIKYENFTIQDIKDVIYKISSGFDELISKQKQVDQYHTPHRSPAFTNQNDTTQIGFSQAPRRENSADDHYALKSQLLDEKERRLVTQEKLNQTKEDQIKYVSEIERLRAQLRSNQSQPSYRVQNENSELQHKLDELHDENVTLKLQIADLESQLVDEQTKKKLTYEQTLESLRAQLHQQFLDQKLKFEEQILQSKETAHNSRLQQAQLEERLMVARETIQHLRQSQQDLERESRVIGNENKQLNQALDYESIKNEQILQRTNLIQTELNVRKQVVDKTSFEKIIAGYEIEIRSLKENGASMDQLVRQKYEDKIKDLQDQNSELVRKQMELGDASRGLGTGLRLNLELAQERNLKLKGLLLRQMLRHSSNLSLMKSFFIIAQIPKKDGQSDDAELLQEQVTQLQQQNQSLTKQLGKILRAVNTHKPIKLSLQGILLKDSNALDFVLQGLKGNQFVSEINFSNNQLDNDDLAKICDVIEGDSKISKLLLAQNQITDASPLIELIKHNGRFLKYIDLSQIIMSDESLREISSALLSLTATEDLAMCAILPEQQSNQNLINKLIDSLVLLKQLKSLDLSKNKFMPETLTYTFIKLATLTNLQALSLSQVGMSDASVFQFTNVLKTLTNLRILNISNNNSISTESIRKLMMMLKSNHVQNLVELNVSKLNFANSEETFKELGLFLIQSKQLRSLCLQKVGLDDATAFYLIEALSKAQKLQTLKLDFNKLTGVFVERYTKKLAQMGYTPQTVLNQGLNPDNSQSVLNSDSEDQTSRLGSARQTPPVQVLAVGQQTIGLLSLSFEGNNIGDRGAEAIAGLIQTKNDATKSLKMVNLNECSIENEGFQKLKQALVARGKLAREYNLTHIGIKVERNNFDQ